MKVVIVGTVGIPACYGGFESLVENITLNSSDDIDYIVFCSGKSYKSRRVSHNGAKLIYLPLSANGVESVFYDIWSLLKVIRIKPDAVLILGVSGCIFLPIFRLFSKSKIITNIDGLEWRRDKWNPLAKRFLRFSERLAVTFSDIIISDNQAITDYVKSVYGVQGETIAYGGDHALRDSTSVEEKGESYALGLCRIEPENNVEIILESFEALGKPLKFVGNWDNSDFGKKLKDRYGHVRNIELLDPIYDLDSLYAIRKNCSLYLHGHSAGGTNPSLVEMMHFGCPILTFDCSFNRYSTENKAHYFTDSITLINLINKLSEFEKHRNGMSMREIARNRYTWTTIAEKYESVF